MVNATMGLGRSACATLFYLSLGVLFSQAKACHLFILLLQRVSYLTFQHSIFVYKYICRMEGSTQNLQQLTSLHVCWVDAVIIECFTLHTCGL